MKEEWQKAYERFLAEVKTTNGRIVPLYFSEAIKHANEVVDAIARAERIQKAKES